MTAQTMNETYGFKTDITSMDDEQVFEYAKSLPLRTRLHIQQVLLDLREKIALLTYLATEKNFAKAQNNLGVFYADGTGVEQNHAAAVSWYQKASDQGLAIAQHNLAFCYAHGEGVEQNHAIAASWYQKAADQGNTTAQHNLGYCYVDGEGVEKNVINGITLIFSAAAKGNSVSQGTLKHWPSSPTIQALSPLAQAHHEAGTKISMAMADEIINPLAPQILKELGAQEPT